MGKRNTSAKTKLAQPRYYILPHFHAANMTSTQKTHVDAISKFSRHVFDWTESSVAFSLNNTLG